MICAVCQHKGSDVESDRCFFCREGCTPDLARLGHAMLKAQGKAAPSAKPKPAKRMIYQVDAQYAGTTMKAAYERLAALDAVPKFDADQLRVIVECLARIRAELQGSDVATYTVADCTARGELLTVWRPTQIATMIKGATLDPFWRSKSLDLNVILSRAQAFYVAGQGKAKKPDTKVILIERWHRAYKALLEANIGAAMDFERSAESLTNATTADLQVWLSTLLAECERRNIDTGDNQ